MKLQAFSLRDTKAEVFAAPFFVPSHGIAVRLLNELVKDKRTDLGKYPQDFILYRVGEYDTDSALLTPSMIEIICTATSCLPRDEASARVPSEGVAG